MANMEPQPQSNNSILGNHPELRNYLLAAVAVPVWAGLTAYTFFGALFSTEWAWIFFAVLIVGPALIGYAMMRSRRGALAGAGAGIVLLPAFGAFVEVSEPAIQWAISVTPDGLLRDVLLRPGASVVPVVSLTAFVCVAVLILASGYARGRAAWLGLSGGLLIGFLLCGIFEYFFAGIIQQSPQSDSLGFFLELPVEAGLVWLSSFAAVDFASRRTGWRGPVWALVLAALMFGLSALVIR